MDNRNAYNLNPLFTIPYSTQKSLALCIPITSIQLHLLHDDSSVENNLLHEIQRYKTQGVYRPVISSFMDINVTFSYDFIILILD